MNILQTKLVSMVTLFYSFIVLICIAEYTELLTLNRSTILVIGTIYVIVGSLVRPDKDLVPALKAIDPDASSTKAKARRMKYAYIYLSFVILIGYSFLFTDTNPDDVIGNFPLMFGLVFGPILFMYTIALIKYYKKLEHY